MLTFSGTNYLGINRHSEFQHLVAAGVDRYGLHFGGSRRSADCPDIFERVEAFLTKWTGADAALVVSSATVAGQLIQQTIGQCNVWVAEGAHPVLYNHLGKVRHFQVAESEDIANTDIEVVLCNALDPLRCTRNNFSFIEALTPSSHLIVDDSHGIGITGRVGSGIWQLLRGRVLGQLTIIASMGKALGIPGGIILSDRKMINQIKRLASFGGSAPPPPCYLYAFLQGQSIYEQQRQLLQDHIIHFHNNLEVIDQFRFLNRYPVFYTEITDLADHLMQQGIRISAFRYPSATDDLITRIVLSSAHQTKDIDRLIKEVNLFFEKKI